MTAMESKACEKGEEEGPTWTTSSHTFLAAACLASGAVRGAGTAAGGEGRTWCTLSSESRPFSVMCRKGDV